MRKKNVSRGFGAVTLALLLSAMFVATAVPALAHHPEVEATAFCEKEDGQVYVDYSTWAWVRTDYYPNPADDQRTNNDDRVYLNGELVASGTFTADNGFTFGGIVPVPSGVTSATVRVVSEVPWGVEENLGSAGEYREVGVELPSDECESPTTTTTTTPPPPPPPPPSPTGTIGDLVWEDTNGDGHQGDFEFGVAGVAVNLLNSNGLVTATTVTDASGKYLFTGLAAGNYEVQFLLPEGYKVSPPRAAGAAVDSDAGVGLRTGAITLASGQVDLTWDAGIFKSQVLPQVITATTSTTVASVTVETLPFTGSSSTGAAGLGVALLALGGLVVLMTRSREDEAVLPARH